MKKLIIILLGLFSINSWAQDVPTYAEFVGGINIDNIQSCASKMQNMCPGIIENNTNKNNIDDDKRKEQLHNYATCMRQQMQTEKVCSQNLALLNKLKPEFVEVINIEHYPFFDAVETKINKDDTQKWYFIVNGRGEFIDTNAVHSDMKNSTVYPYLIRKYPNTILGNVQQNSFPPRYETLPLGEMRLVFSRSLLNGCKTCEKIGYMEDGYDFKSDGTFKWVKFLKIVPDDDSLKL